MRQLWDSSVHRVGQNPGQSLPFEPFSVLGIHFISGGHSLPGLGKEIGHGICSEVQLAGSGHFSGSFWVDSAEAGKIAADAGRIALAGEAPNPETGLGPRAEAGKIPGACPAPLGGSPNSSGPGRPSGLNNGSFSGSYGVPAPKGSGFPFSSTFSEMAGLASWGG